MPAHSPPSINDSHHLPHLEGTLQRWTFAIGLLSCPSSPVTDNILVASEQLTLGWPVKVSASLFHGALGLEWKVYLVGSMTLPGAEQL